MVHDERRSVSPDRDPKRTWPILQMVALIVSLIRLVVDLLPDD